MYESFYRKFAATQEDFEYTNFDGHNNPFTGVMATLEDVTDQQGPSVAEFAVQLQEENQTAFALRSLGIAAVLASADGPLPFGDALAVGWLVGAGIYGLVS
jgi:hypothetical protein